MHKIILKISPTVGLLTGLFLMNLCSVGFSEGSTKPVAAIKSATCAQSADYKTVQAFVGLYKGTITYTGQTDHYPVVNELFLNPECKLSGRYQYKDGETLVDGTFYPISLIDAQTLEANWNDQYGKGKWKAIFSPDHKSFDGTWGNEEDAASEGTWSGKR